MEMTRVETDRAPAAIGPYSQAVVVDGWVYVSGQVALDRETGELVSDDVVEQAEHVLRNMAAILEEAGANMESVVKATMYLADMNDFPRVNEVYARHFGNHRPARAAVGVAALPKRAAVEMEAVAHRG